jgi:hypothetical protein
MSLWSLGIYLHLDDGTAYNNKSSSSIKQVLTIGVKTSFMTERTSTIDLVVRRHC